MSEAPLFSHTTVLLHETVDGVLNDPSGIYVDGTFGRGGHSRLLLSRLAPDGRLIAIDRDPEAVAAATTGATRIDDPRFSIVHSAFADMRAQLAALGLAQVQGILLDLGVSSPHIDTNGQCQYGCSGNGVGGAAESGSGNQHTVDNNGDGRVDFILLKFSTAVDLTSAYFNVYDVNPDGGADGDAAAYYKGGAFAPVNGGSATSYFNQFTSLALPGSSSGSRNIGGVTFSDTWLIGADPSSSNDGFKLYSISYDAAVPEPATWLTMILGFGGIGAMMRRRRQLAPIAA